MSWFPEPPPSAALLATDPQDSWSRVPFYKGLLDRTEEALLACWAGEPVVEDPRYGLVRGAAAFAEYVTTVREWLALSDATVRPVALTSTAARSLEEVGLSLEVGGVRQDTGVAVVTEWDVEHRLTRIRLYYDLLLFPSPPALLPSLSAGGHDPVPTLVADLHRAVAAADLDAVLACYEPGAVLVDPEGGSEPATGREELRRRYAVPDLPGAAGRTEVGAVLDDGRTCAVEEQVTGYGEALPSRVGWTVYERGPSGRILREHRYRVPATSASRVSSRFGATRGRTLELPQPAGEYAAARSADE